MFDPQPEETISEPVAFPPPPIALPVELPAVHDRGAVAAVTTIGVILIILAVLSLLPFIICLVGSTDKEISEFTHQMMVMLVAISMLAIPFLFIMGIGLLIRAAWARRGTIITLISLYIGGTLAICLMVAAMADSPTATSGSAPMTVSARFLGGLAAALVILLPPIMTGTMIHFLTRPEVKALFRNAGERARKNVRQQIIS